MMSSTPYDEKFMWKKNIEVHDERNPMLRCKSCGTVWVPDAKSGGAFHKDWWKCPRGCNQ